MEWYRSSYDQDYNNANYILFPDATGWNDFLNEYYSSMTNSWVWGASLAVQTYGSSGDHIDLYDFCNQLVQYAPGN